MSDQGTANILSKARPPKYNIPKREIAALKSLNSDESITILPADKGNATVILKTEEYNNKIEELLDPVNYRKLQRDPTQSELRNLIKIIRSSSLSETTQKVILLTEAVPPRLYGLSKIHKANMPLRPIVTESCHSDLPLGETSGLAPPTNSYVKDSTDFVGKIRDLTLEPTDILVSFDVVSLFTNVPLEDSLRGLAHMFQNDIVELFRACLTGSYFQWEGNFYEQLDGVAMGSPLSPVIANYFMERYEGKAIETFELKPTLWLRYVDDTFVIWKHGRNTLNRFLDHLNAQHSSIEFTMEIEQYQRIAFLDVLVVRCGTRLTHKVYRKPTNTDRYLHALSNHHPSQKRGVISTLTEQARRICGPEDLERKLKYLEVTLRSNGYSASETRRAMRPKGTTV
ncbi:uncharacterized protein [Leptinotarsa decemlineata]|uniref:uncharacterized protein n=1 Tax=Leptinotarsa decemlineata TaxID=7539 RepID=UPI003D30B0E0